MPSSRKKNNRRNVQDHPQIVELKSLDEVRKYTDAAGAIPKDTLYSQLERLNQQHPQASTASPPSPSSSSPPNVNPADDPELSLVGRFMFRALDYTMYLIPMLSVHLVLDVLVRMQYSQQLDGDAILLGVVKTAPVLVLLFQLVHPYKALLPFKVLSAMGSVAIGMYLLYVTNEEGYYLVMKRAPPLGTLWVGMFVEMEWEWSAVCLMVVGVWMKYMNYGF